jgi:hypothetical protein
MHWVLVAYYFMGADPKGYQATEYASRSACVREADRQRTTDPHGVLAWCVEGGLLDWTFVGKALQEGDEYGG